MSAARKILFILFLSFIFASHAFAKTDDASIKPDSESGVVEKRNRVQDRQGDLMENTSVDTEKRRIETKAEVKERIQNKAQETRMKLAQMHAERLGKRFTFYYERLQKLIDKLRNRIMAMGEKGIDVSTAQSKLDEASALLESTKTSADQAIALFKSIGTEDMKNTGDVGKQAVGTAEGVRKNYVEVVKLLREVVSLLKEAHQSAESASLD